MVEQAKSCAEQIKNVMAELDVIKNRAKVLRALKKDLDSKMQEFLEEKDMEAVRYGDLVFMKVERKVKPKLKKNEKKDHALKILEGYGVEDAEKAYKEMQEPQLQEETKVQLKIKRDVFEI